MGPYQVSSNYSPGVKFDPTLGVTSFTWDYIGKILEISLYVAIRPVGNQNYLVGLYKECPNYSPGVKFGPAPGVTSFTLAFIGKILEISLYVALRSRDTKFCM